MNNCIIEVIKLIVSSGALVTGIFAGVKYFHEKNREIYLKRLDNVYAPLYSYIVKQEIGRNVMFDVETREGRGNFNNSPILTLKHKKEDIKRDLFTRKVIENNSTEESIIDRKNLVEICSNVDRSLMTPKLLNLISTYEILIFLEEFLDNDDPKFLEVSVKRVDIEKKLVKEIIIGYSKTIKKLGIDSSNDVININSFDIDKL